MRNCQNIFLVDKKWELIQGSFKKSKFISGLNKLVLKSHFGQGSKIHPAALSLWYPCGRRGWHYTSFHRIPQPSWESFREIFSNRKSTSLCQRKFTSINRGEFLKGEFTHSGLHSLDFPQTSFSPKMMKVWELYSLKARSMIKLPFCQHSCLEFTLETLRPTLRKPNEGKRNLIWLFLCTA